jgi:hypothetical protein
VSRLSYLMKKSYLGMKKSYLGRSLIESASNFVSNN